VNIAAHYAKANHLINLLRDRLNPPTATQLAGCASYRLSRRAYTRGPDRRTVLEVLMASGGLIEF
jgi:hypothetical protein